MMLETTPISALPASWPKEKRWASQVEYGLMDGDVVWLSANKQPFMSLYTPSETNTNFI
jgi:hypothetical protein